MAKVVSANEAKQRWGAMLGFVSEQGDEVIVESHGKPKAVLISFAAYQEVQTLREQKRRADILDRLRTLARRLGERNPDLTDDEAMMLADRFSHDLIDDLAAEGTLRFERDRR
jgi:prevent-host-death family protein